MRYYTQLIASATGVTDPAVLDEHEEIMREDIFHSTLSWQTEAQLRAAASEALVIRKAVREIEQTAQDGAATRP